MTKQEIFDKALSGIIAQGGQCIGDDGRCAYRIGDNKCAIGHLIPDDLYWHGMEMRGIQCILSLSPNLAGCLGFSQELTFYRDTLQGDENRKHLLFLIDLQRAHDGSMTKTTLEVIIKNFKDVAIKHGLDFNFTV